jgi:hypothetical protein
MGFKTPESYDERMQSTMEKFSKKKNPGQKAWVLCKTSLQDSSKNVYFRISRDITIF